ncbi:unnamed protein product [Eruca vesicaria subsp. sativa]|uniref:FCP1 homology domain-containing protein n=1 Tax=Eruca vesicaria subsp. sativa TaxID=29727 RepID=A0ABC8LVW2_ERUVS|nr:unnamed protein product [Eruca vesicaria subsp. sativa]
MMTIIGTTEDDIIVDQVTSQDTVDDFELGKDEVVDVKDKEIKPVNPCCKGKKLRVLDIDYTLFDHHLHEFLTAAYAEYDIILWSATSMKCVELKMGELGVLNNPNYKITGLLDHLAMITSYIAQNTIMFNDLRRNFVMNPQNGLKIRPFRKAHVNRDKDDELIMLTQYLLAIAELDDLSSLDHSRWETFTEDNVKRRRHT